MSADLVPDDLWERIAPLLPDRPARRHRHPGRLSVSDRIALAGIVYVLRKSVAWCDVPIQVVVCSGVTAWRRLRDWTEAGVWHRLREVLLAELRAAGLLEMDDSAIDGSHVRVVKGGSHRTFSGRPGKTWQQAPPDRRPPRNPARLTLTGGNRHDVTQLLPLLDAIPPIRGLRGHPRTRPRSLFADRGYAGHAGLLQHRFELRRVPALVSGPARQPGAAWW